MSERTMDAGPGFVRARECPDCGHTRCGEDCTCNCDAARAECEAAALRQRAEALERQWHDAEAALALEADERRCAEVELAAERDLKLAAYAKLDQAREAVEKTIIPALEHLLEWAEWQRKRHPAPAMGEPNTGARAEAWSALAAARKTLED